MPVTLQSVDGHALRVFPAGFSHASQIVHVAGGWKFVDSFWKCNSKFQAESQPSMHGCVGCHGGQAADVLGTNAWLHA